MTADTEEVLGDALKTRGEKLHYIYDPTSSWKVVLAGAGDLDYILMVRDFIEDKLKASKGNDADIIEAIRDSVHEIWRDYARFEPGANVQLKLLIGSWSNDGALRFTVVSGAAVRTGRQIEAMGIGDATFLGMADRFLPRGFLLPYTVGDTEALRVFMIYAAQAAKQVPGVGGMTRVITLDLHGNLKYEKSFKVIEVQRFFGNFHDNISQIFSGFIGDQKNPEETVKIMGRKLIKDIRALRKKLAEIEANPALL
jgi:hypothetical protein